MRLAQWASVRFASFNLLWMILDGAFAGFAAATTAEHDAARTGLKFARPQPPLFLTCPCPVQGRPRWTRVNCSRTSELTGRRGQADRWCVSIRTAHVTIRTPSESSQRALSRRQVFVTQSSARSYFDFSEPLVRDRVPQASWRTLDALWTPVDAF